MKLKELIGLYRMQAFDKVEDYFCSDEELAIYANEAQDEACRRAQLLVDSSSPMCKVQIPADAHVVKLDARIINVQRAFVERQPLGVVSVQEMDAIWPGWQFEAANTQVTHLVTGMTTGAVHLFPRPIAAVQIQMTVQRLPLKPMSKECDEPEIRSELHKALVDWMLFRAYSREDTDLYNDTKATLRERSFEAEFGSKVSARNEEWVRRGAGMLPGAIA